MVLNLARLEGKAPAALVNVEIDSLAVLGCIVNQIPHDDRAGSKPFPGHQKR